MPRLRDPVNMQLTAVGRKELAVLKSLQALNLSRAEATAAGVAALQMDLPACEIVLADR